MPLILLLSAMILYSLVSFIRAGFGPPIYPDDEVRP